MNDANLVEGKSVEEIESLYLALKKVWVFNETDATNTEILRSRIDEQSTLISILKQRSDELLVRCQALQKINSELEDQITDCHEELEKERKKYETLEKRFMDLASNNQAIIVFKDEYKSQNVQLRQKNQQLQSENESLFSKKLQDKEAAVQNLTEEINQLKDKCAQKEHDYSERIDGFKAKFLKQTNDYEAREASLIEKLQSLEEIQRNTVALCDDLKEQLKKTEEECTSKETNMTETIAALHKEKDKFLQVSVERGKLIQEKQEELKQMEIKVREEKQRRTKAEERFKQESQLVNTNARVKSLQSVLDESATKYEKLKKDFEAFKEHSTNLLIYERELNKKLSLMTG
ncbi:coiled-coil domain-containing protein 89 [Periophthalmus magnuspinnatus]|uniref:coiled-coil domain-containing protein 89 n=1 Tax=Periophthalmus magnuspinnatus TaxID=409849 RepID=UPI00145B86C6|nr:coiled-coil domain-containing protein 89 [Periophthalmus magnuspinnatus]